MSIFPPLFSRETYVYDFEHFVVTKKMELDRSDHLL